MQPLKIAGPSVLTANRSSLARGLRFWAVGGLSGDLSMLRSDRYYLSDNDNTSQQGFRPKVPTHIVAGIIIYI